MTYGTQFAGKEEALAGRFYEVLFANGGDYFDAELNPIFDSEAGVASAKWMQDLYANGLDPARHAEPPVARGPSNFCNGDVAFYLEWYGWYGYLQDPERARRSPVSSASHEGLSARPTPTRAGPAPTPSVEGLREQGGGRPS